MIINLLIGIIGFIAGILVNYLADVLPQNRRLVTPYCLGCGEKQSLTNYLFWPRQCQHCGNHRPWRTYVVELLLIVTSIYLWRHPTFISGYILALILFMYFILVTIIDMEHRLILHPVSLVGAGLGLIVGIWGHGIIETIIGGMSGFLIMLGLYFIGIGFVRLMAHIRGEIIEREGLGFGDVILTGVIGLFLGWPGVLLGLILTILLAGLINLIYLFIMVLTKRYNPNLALPFGPFLAVSVIALLFFKDIVLAPLGW
jgi:leader peptidase (prepilin peptidase)/N-methyltransferase